MQSKGFTGQPFVYIGRVVGQNNNPVNGAVVWRVGGAGRTTAESDGRFRLVDAFGDLHDHLSPSKVAFMASSGDRWGYAFVDFGQASAKAEIKLDRQGNAPRPPQLVLDVRNPGTDLTKSPRQLDSGPTLYFTARWPDQTNVGGNFAVSLNPEPADLRSVQNQGCYGDCSGYKGNIRVIKLPTQGKFTLGIDANAGIPNWAEAQVVAGR
jgi:hypothetical protein